MPVVQIASAPPCCHCEKERRSNPGEGEDELRNPQKQSLFRTTTMGRILTLRSALDQHHLMDRFVVPPRDDNPNRSADGSDLQTKRPFLERSNYNESLECHL